MDTLKWITSTGEPDIVSAGRWKTLDLESPPGLRTPHEQGGLKRRASITTAPPAQSP